jgi:hypothetical protein
LRTCLLMVVNPTENTASTAPAAMKYSGAKVVPLSESISGSVAMMTVMGAAAATTMYTMPPTPSPRPRSAAGTESTGSDWVALNLCLLSGVRRVDDVHRVREEVSSLKRGAPTLGRREERPSVPEPSRSSTREGPGERAG